MDLPPVSKQEKIKLTEINEHLVCYLCKGYLIDATTISECLHSFCRSCIIKFLQENSFCPVCELVINKAKPNLKLDKTLQDIVYKLVPELFLKEMLRRKTFFKDKPEIACRVPPEERGEDTERTIFNPRETISLSLEYICDDSSPGAIRIPGIILTDPESLKNNGTIDVSEESQMKRYLLCPGMCRVEVLKKFVRNKYNVDTNQFFIDILYKRVPLPDHYTLIDIAYIYSWQRNELMKFFFRILDKNKPRNTDSPVNILPQFIPRHFRKRSTRKERKSMSAKVINITAKREEASMERVSSFPQKIIDNELIAEDATKKGKEIVNVKFEKCSSDTTAKVESEKILQETEIKQSDKLSVPTIRFKEEKLLANSISIKKEPLSPSEAQKADDKLLVKMSEEFLNSSKISSKSPSLYSQSVTKSYTSITLNRSENVEIITKIEPLSNEDGHPIGHHIIKQTIKKGSKIKSPRKITPKPSQVTIPRLALSEKTIKRKTPPKMVKNETFIKDDYSEYNFEPDDEDEKTVFFNYIKLAPTNQVLKKHVNKSRKHLLLNKPLGGQKRKHSSPVKNDKNKVAKLEAKKSVKIILQDKPETNKNNKNLQSTINSFKIPSSLSITIKESSEKHNASPIAPPVKNYIEILKIPEEGSTGVNEEKKSAEQTVLCDNDSEQKVDQDLSDIAKSLTEKIPMTTTISQLFSPKQSFKPNIPSSNNNAQILPSPVPELSKSLISGTQNSSKLNSRTPQQQTFQKIFEESLKKSPEGAKTSAVEIVQDSTNNKKNVPEIAAPLEKKMKLESPVEEAIKSPILPKVQIPRLPPKSQKLPPMVPQTIANLHSTSLGLNYTVSVGQQSPSKTMKSNGTISPKAESIPLEIKSAETAQKIVKSEFKVPSPNRISPKASSSSETKPKSPSPTKNSPKSSPLVKHMYGSSNSQISRLPPTSSSSPSSSSSSSSLSPNSNITSSSSNNSIELLDKYNIQNLAQLSASFNLNPAMLTNNNQLAAIQHAMLLQRFEIQNRQNWLSRNQGPLLQYEKYLQSLNGSLSGSQGKT